MEFDTQGEAECAGLVFRAPTIEEYRGWLIIVENRCGQMTFSMRKKSGEHYSSGSLKKFRWINFPTNFQPKPETVKLNDRPEAFSQNLVSATPRSEIERAANHARRLIDRERDGEFDVDLIE